MKSPARKPAEASSENRRGSWATAMGRISPSVYISIAALLVSMTSFGWTVFQETDTRIRQDREEMRKLVVDMIEISDKDNASGEGLAKSKIEVMLSALNSVESQYEAPLSHAEYSMIGYLESLYGDVDRAKDAYSKAVAKTNDDFLIARTYSQLAGILRIVSRKRNLNEAIEYQELAVRHLNRIGDDRAQAHLVAQYCELAVLQELSGKRSLSEQSLKNGADALAKIADGGWRQMALSQIHDSAADWPDHIRSVVSQW